MLRSSFETNKAEGKDQKNTSPDRPVRQLYSSLSKEAEEKGNVKPESDEVERKVAAKQVMRERGAFLAEHNPKAHERVLEIREKAREVKTLLDKAKATTVASEKAELLASADAIGNYSELIHEAVSLFNSGYEEAVIIKKNAEMEKGASDAAKLEAARARLEIADDPAVATEIIEKKETERREERERRDEVRGIQFNVALGRGSERDPVIIKPRSARVTHPPQGIFSRLFGRFFT